MPAPKKTKPSILAQNFGSVLILSAVIIFGAAYLLYFRAELKKFSRGGIYNNSALGSELELRKNELGKIRAAAEALIRISADDKQKIGQFLPDAPDEPSLINAITSIAQSSGLTLLSVGVEPGPAPRGNLPRGIKTVEITLGVGGGDYARFKTFLEGIEKNVRLLDIETVGYTPGSAAYSIRLKAYYLE